MHQFTLPKGFRPKSLSGKGFVLRPQKIEDAEADYRTVMANREHLYNWCNDTWPADDFNLNDNRDDLAGHIEDAETGFAFGYTVWTENLKEVLGSVYLYPSAFFADRYQLNDEERSRLTATQVLVDYWLSYNLEVDAKFTRDFIVALQTWLLDDWGFKESTWSTRPGMQQRRLVYESLGFTWGRVAESLNTPGWFQTYHISSGAER